jgi:primosomal protein N' (replication factor Y)
VAQGRIEAAAHIVRPVAEKHHVRVLGPVSCPLSRLKDRFRWHLLLKAESREAIRAVLDETWAQVRSRVGGVIVDVEPVDLL